MKIIEFVGCPLCDGKISVIVEDNRITSHGLCPKCDRPFSPEHLNFAEEAKGYVDKFMEQEYPIENLLNEIDREVREFYSLVWDVYLDEFYQMHLDEMAEENLCVGCETENTRPFACKPDCPGLL